MRQAHGRIIIDAKEYSENVATGTITFIAGKRQVRVSEIKEDSFSDEELLLCSCTVYAFSLVLRKWGLFFVPRISEVRFNHSAFNDLVVPTQQKAMIRSLVSDHENRHSNFDDLIEGKGKGIIFLLHGPPGVGKTLTAGKLFGMKR